MQQLEERGFKWECNLANAALSLWIGPGQEGTIGVEAPYETGAVAIEHQGRALTVSYKKDQIDTIRSLLVQGQYRLAEAFTHSHEAGRQVFMEILATVDEFTTERDYAREMLEEMLGLDKSRKDVTITLSPKQSLLLSGLVSIGTLAFLEAGRTSSVNSLITGRLTLRFTEEHTEAIMEQIGRILPFVLTRKTQDSKEADKIIKKELVAFLSYLQEQSR